MSRDLLKLSEGNWKVENPTFKSIKTSALMRIANAIEPISENYSALMSENDYLKGEVKRLNHEIKHLKRSNAGLKGALTKKRNKDNND